MKTKIRAASPGKYRGINISLFWVTIAAVFYAQYHFYFTKRAVDAIVPFLLALGRAGR